MATGALAADGCRDNNRMGEGTGYSRGALRRLRSSHRPNTKKSEPVPVVATTQTAFGGFFPNFGKHRLFDVTLEAKHNYSNHKDLHKMGRLNLKTRSATRRLSPPPQA